MEKWKKGEIEREVDREGKGEVVGNDSWELGGSRQNTLKGDGLGTVANETAKNFQICEAKKRHQPFTETERRRTRIRRTVAKGGAGKDRKRMLFSLKTSRKKIEEG